jgi:hypothetical protein
VALTSSERLVLLQSKLEQGKVTREEYEAIVEADRAGAVLNAAAEEAEGNQRAGGGGGGGGHLRYIPEEDPPTATVIHPIADLWKHKNMIRIVDSAACCVVVCQDANQKVRVSKQ